MSQPAQSVKEAINQAYRATTKGDLILVTGSFHVAGEAKRLLAEKRGTQGIEARATNRCIERLVFASRHKPCKAMVGGTSEPQRFLQLRQVATHPLGPSD
eukprot:TRINITY_DN93248_c0_g1_i2.p1 TRINITY_DN93248_c0_g1~~TRINITY_DN93248_c0_g1_i2.p1  ORF type:complete len:113 (+),score=9.21 TRINITY_DN93248_c0_g1_i2:41-340(+)